MNCFRQGYPDSHLLLFPIASGSGKWEILVSEETHCTFILVENKEISQIEPNIILLSQELCTLKKCIPSIQIEKICSWGANIFTYLQRYVAGFLPLCQTWTVTCPWSRWLRGEKSQEPAFATQGWSLQSPYLAKFWWVFIHFFNLGWAQE